MRLIPTATGILDTVLKPHRIASRPAQLATFSSMSTPVEDVAMSQAPEAESSNSNPVPADGQAQPLSKNQMKKAARLERMKAARQDKRQAERARKKEREAALREKYAAGTLTEEEKEAFEKRKALRQARRDDGHVEKDEWKGGVIIDLGFDDLMHDGEITSMASQVSYCYSANRTASRPFSTILHTSIGPTASPRLWAKLAKVGWPKWSRSYWWEQGMDEVAKAFTKTQAEEPSESNEGAGAVQATTPAVTDAEVPGAELVRYLSGPALPPGLSADTHKIVYLSADADEELTTLSEDEVYIIGGIVDRNRHKMLCQNKAVGLGIRTARLPIGTFLENLPTRKVLTVNQVFEILSQYVAQQDWAKAFDAVIPQRKYEAVGRQAQKRRKLREERKGGEAASDGEGEGEGESGAESDGEGAVLDEEAAMNS